MPKLTAARRAGFTLVEVLIVLTILGIVGASLMTMITRQQRFYRDTSASLVVRRELRGGASLLPTEMRAIARRGTRADNPNVEGDILSMNATAIVFRATFGSSIICEKPAGDFTTFSVPPTGLAHHTLTSWYETPGPGDQVAIFNEGPLPGAEDDDWVYATIDAVTESATACSPSPYMDPILDPPATKRRYTITVTPATWVGAALPAAIQTGAVVRFLRDTRYHLYQPSGSTRWFLGYQQRVNGAWTNSAAVAGPFEESAANGLRFQYYDTTGAATIATAAVSRVDVLLKGKADFASTAERRGTPFADSLMFRIGIRNFK